MKIKVGDYIEGFEQVGTPAMPEYDIESTLKTRKMRIIVSNIYTDNHGNKVYSGAADDTFKGARGTTLSTEHGDVRIIEDEEPFTVRWWTDKYKKYKLTENGLKV